IPYTPAQTPNKVNSYKIDNNIEGNIQEDTEMYANYLKSLEGRSETKIVLPKLIKDYGEAKIDLPQLVDIVAVSKHVLLIT
ncbi:hypothetical protein V2W45_1237536, partial [Cenococcum geophilum]